MDNAGNFNVAFELFLGCKDSDDEDDDDEGGEEDMTLVDSTTFREDRWKQCQHFGATTTCSLCESHS